MNAVTTLLAGCALAALLIGLGGLARWVLRAERAGWLGPFALFWLGWALELLVLQLWHLAAPVSGWVYAALLPLAAVGAWRLTVHPPGHPERSRGALDVRDPQAPLADHPERSRGSLDRRSTLPLFAAFAVGALLALYACHRVLAAPAHPDACLYYVQSVRWAGAFPLVRGLALFNPLLALNHAYYLFAGSLGVGPFAAEGYRLANAPLLISVAAFGSHRLARLALGRGPLQAEDLLGAVLLALSLDELMRDPASPNADAALWAAKAALAWMALCPLPALGDSVGSGAARDASLHPAARASDLGGGGAGDGGSGSSGSSATMASKVEPDPAIPASGDEFARDPCKPEGARLASVLFLGAACVAAKLSAAVTVLPLVAWALWRERRHLCAALPGAAAALTLGLAWCLRGVLLTGYPLFPSGLLGFSVPWRFAEQDRAYLAGYIGAFARYQVSRYGEPLPAGPWVMHWLTREWVDNRQLLLPLGVLALGAIGMTLGALRARKVPAVLPPLLPVLVALGLWLLAAPDVRFVAPVPWVAAALALFGVLAVLPERLPRRGLAIAFAASALAGGFIGVDFSQVGTLRWKPTPLQESVTSAQLASGEAVHVYAGCCLEPPCAQSPRPLPHVRLRSPGDFSSGFLPAP